MITQQLYHQILCYFLDKYCNYFSIHRIQTICPTYETCKNMLKNEIYQNFAISILCLFINVIKF